MASRTSHKHLSVPTRLAPSLLLATFGLPFGFHKSAFSESGDRRGAEVPDSPALECLTFPQETWSVSSRGLDLDRRVHALVSRRPPMGKTNGSAEAEALNTELDKVSGSNEWFGKGYRLKGRKGYF